jgi:hypothetical protein
MNPDIFGSHIEKIRFRSKVRGHEDKPQPGAVMPATVKFNFPGIRMYYFAVPEHYVLLLF